MSVSCLVCGKVYLNRSNLNRHRQEAHKLQGSYKSYDGSLSNKNFKCLEKNCNNVFHNTQNLREHLFDMHDINTKDVRELIFSSFEEFEIWFQKEMKENVISYYRCRKSKEKQYITSYYYCNRSGVARKDIQNKDRTRAPKIQGSCKINCFCTSQVIARKEILTNKILVDYFYQHYGHKKELKHIRIPKDDKEVIASKLIAGIEPSTILNEQRENGADNEFQRINLLRRKDILNIKASYNITNSYQETCHTTNDNNEVTYKSKNNKITEKSRMKNPRRLITMTHARHRIASAINNYKIYGNTVTNLDGVVFIITKNRDDACCYIKCSFCNICVHSYSCTCIDFITQKIICKHIHFFILNTNKTVDNNTSLNTSVSEVNKTNLLTDLRITDNTRKVNGIFDNEINENAFVTNPERIQELKLEIQQYAHNITNNVINKDYTYEQLSEISKYLKAAVSVNSTINEKVLKIEPNDAHPIIMLNKNIIEDENKRSYLYSYLIKPSNVKEKIITDILNDHDYL